MKMFNITIKGHGINLGIESKNKKDAIKSIILQYKDWYNIDITESDIVDIYKVVVRKYKGK
jgi:uncharacterized protein YlxP (DUF503 family)